MGKYGRCAKYIAIHERVSFTNLFLPYITGVLFHLPFFYKLLHSLLYVFLHFFASLLFLVFYYLFFRVSLPLNFICTSFSLSLIPARRPLPFFHFLSYFLLDYCPFSNSPSYLFLLSTSLTSSLLISPFLSRTERTHE